MTLQKADTVNCLGTAAWCQNFLRLSHFSACDLTKSLQMNGSGSYPTNVVCPMLTYDGTCLLCSFCSDVTFLKINFNYW